MSIEATGNKIVDLHPSSGGGGGSSNYNELTNRPQINSVTLAGDKTGAQLGLQDKLQEDSLRTIVIAGNVISVNGTLYYTKEQVDAKFTGVAKTYIVAALPATPDANTYYLVGNDVDGYTLYYYDDNMQQAVIGSYDLDLTIYAKKEQKIGTTAFQGDVTVANLFNDLKDYTGTITNKTIDADDNTIQDLTINNFKLGIVLTVIPESGATDTTLATVRAIKNALNNKQDKITTTSYATTPQDTDSLSDLLGTTNKRWTFAAIWNWIKGKLTLETFADGTLTASRVLYTDANKKLATSTITPTKLGYLANVTSDIQNQLNDKLNPTWNYVGILSARNGSTLTVKDDWTELCLVIRVTEGSSYFNLTNVVPKVGFTQGSPNGNCTFIGFNWNTSFNVGMRVGLEQTGDNRRLKVNWTHETGWANNGVYVFKR